MAGERNLPVAVDRNKEEEPQTEEDEKSPLRSLPVVSLRDDCWGNISLGNQYDVRDTEGYWCEAEVSGAVAGHTALHSYSIGGASISKS